MISSLENRTCPDGWYGKGHRPSLCFLAGLFIGLLTAIISGLVGNLPSGHQPNDPILLALSLGGVLRGFTYFNWRFLLMTLGFPIVTSGLSVVSVKMLARKGGRFVKPDDADQVVKVAILVGVIPVWFQEVDAIQVLIWYAVATWFAMLIAGFVARQWVKFFMKSN